MSNFGASVTGWFFIAAAVMLWSGWTFLPAKPGTFFEPNDFSSIRRRLQTWIWLYRVHLFGHITTVMAFVALATLLAETPIRVVTWPPPSA